MDHIVYPYDVYYSGGDKQQTFPSVTNSGTIGYNICIYSNYNCYV